MKISTQYIGAAGQYFVAYNLSLNNLNTSITIGNTPYVDILVSSETGKASLCIQVKTSSNAFKNRYGKKGFEWTVGKKAVNHFSSNLIYALVDLHLGSEGLPDVYFVPSKWIGNFVKDDFSMNNYFLGTKEEKDFNELIKHTKNRFDIIYKILNSSQEGLNWLDYWPTEKLIQWGSNS